MNGDVEGSQDLEQGVQANRHLAVLEIVENGLTHARQSGQVVAAQAGRLAMESNQFREGGNYRHGGYFPQ